jgi:hypothetical protein
VSWLDLKRDVKSQATKIGEAKRLEEGGEAKAPVEGGEATTHTENIL